jgi:predicted RNA-binding Zn ribbon-like protein
MAEKKRSASNLELIGGELCLDFVNTVSTRVEGLGREYFLDYGELVAWSQHVGIINKNEAEDLLHTAAQRPGKAETVLGEAIDLRETIYRIFLAAVNLNKPAASDIKKLNAAVHNTFAHLEIAASRGGFEWKWAADKESLERMLWTVVRSATELLTSEKLNLVRQCAREGCDWLFLDLSKNHSRRWCSMDMCGSRMKARRYYQRKKKKERE